MEGCPELDKLEKNPLYVARRIEGQGYLIPLSEDPKEMRKIYRLNDLGWLVWDVAGSGKDLQEMCLEISGKYDAGLETVLSDVSRFLRKLVGIGALIQPGKTDG